MLSLLGSKQMVSQRESVYHKIRDAITYGKLKPGERLVEKRLCEIFTVGRTALREGLSQLQIEGYLDFVPNQGWTITRMSVQNVKEIYHTIALMEGYATELATKSISFAERKKLIVINNHLRKASELKDYKMWLEKNVLFHELLVKAGRNEFLYKMVGSLRNRIYRYRLISLTIIDSLEEASLAHDEIFEGISQKDGKRAGSAMQEHVLCVANRLITFLEQLPGF